MKYLIIIALAMPVTGKAQNFGWSDNSDPYGVKAMQRQDEMLRQNYMQQEQLRLLREQNEMIRQQQNRGGYVPYNPFAQ